MATLTTLPLGRLIRRHQLAELCGHSVAWIDREARRAGTPLVAVRGPSGRVIGFTEDSARALLGCPVSKKDAAQ